MEQRNPKEVNLESWQVEAYLQENPDFFLSRSEILATLILEHVSGTAVSLIERQVSLLRDKNQQLKKQMAVFIDAARSNEKTNQQVYDLILHLLAKPYENAQLIEMTERFLVDELGADYCKILPIESFTASFMTDLQKRSNQSGVYQGRMNALCAEHLFKDNPLEIKSVVCVRMGSIDETNKDERLLVLGSTSSERYQESAGTWFVEQITAVLSTLLQQK